MTDHVSVVVTSAPGSLVLRLSGELDIATVDACRADLTDAIEDRLGRKPSDSSGEPPLARVVIDLSDLTFLAVAGLRMLGGIAARLERHHIKPIAAVPSTGIIRQLVYLAALDQQMQIVDASCRDASASVTTATAMAKQAGNNPAAHSRGTVRESIMPRAAGRAIQQM